MSEACTPVSSYAVKGTDHEGHRTLCAFSGRSQAWLSDGVRMTTCSAAAAVLGVHRLPWIQHAEQAKNGRERDLRVLQVCTGCACSFEYLYYRILQIQEDMTRHDTNAAKASATNTRSPRPPHLVPDYGLPTAVHGRRSTGGYMPQNQFYGYEGTGDRQLQVPSWCLLHILGGGTASRKGATAC